jgi:hypothetical protein
MTITNGNDSPQTAAKRYDFNGDGYPDYVLVKFAAQIPLPPLATVIWYLQDNLRNGVAVGPTIRDDFGLVDAADINRDGHTDYVLFNPQTRQTKVLFMDSRVPPRLLGSRLGPTVGNPGFKLQKVGNFNRDSSPDWVLFNSSTRQTIIWFMQGTQIQSRGFGPELPSRWELNSVADFDGDGIDDFLLVKFIGEPLTQIWYMQGRQRRGDPVDGPTIANTYRLLGAADFDKDGHPDYLLWQPAPPKRTAIWYLENNHIAPPPHRPWAVGPEINPVWTLALP